MKILDLDAADKPVSSAPKVKKPPPGALKGKKPAPGAAQPKAPAKRRSPLIAFLLGGLAVILVAGAAGWIIVRNWPEEIRFDLEEVETAVDPGFPATGRYLSLLDATVSNPRVGLVAGSDRVGMKFNLSLTPTENAAKWSGAEQASRLELNTEIDVTTGIRYVPETGAVYLDDPVVERLDVRGTPIDFQNRAPQLIADVIESGLKTRPVYTIKATDVKSPPSRLRLKSYTVEDAEVVVALRL